MTERPSFVLAVIERTKVPLGRPTRLMSALIWERPTDFTRLWSILMTAPVHVTPGRVRIWIVKRLRLTHCFAGGRAKAVVAESGVFGATCVKPALGDCPGDGPELDPTVVSEPLLVEDGLLPGAGTG